jgi:hypothetical protein
MTIKELIEKLQSFPQDKEIYVMDLEGEYKPTEVVLIEKHPLLFDDEEDRYSIVIQ